MMVNYRAGLCPPRWVDKRRFFCHNFPASKGASLTQTLHLKCYSVFSLLQTLTNAILQTRVTRMLLVTTVKDLTTALVKEDLKATGELTAQVLKILLKSIPNHQNQIGTLLSSKMEIPATFEWIRLTTQQFSVSFICYRLFHFHSFQSHLSPMATYW